MSVDGIVVRAGISARDAHASLAGAHTPAIRAVLDAMARRLSSAAGPVLDANAADVAVDADGDGRFTAFDAQWVQMAAELVERAHPELVGGVGLYTNVGAPYAHLDVRGRRARWWRR